MLSRAASVRLSTKRQPGTVEKYQAPSLWAVKTSLSTTCPVAHETPGVLVAPHTGMGYDHRINGRQIAMSEHSFGIFHTIPGRFGGWLRGFQGKTALIRLPRRKKKAMKANASS